MVSNVFALICKFSAEKLALHSPTFILAGFILVSARDIFWCVGLGLASVIIGLMILISIPVHQDISRKNKRSVTN